MLQWNREQKQLRDAVYKLAPKLNSDLPKAARTASFPQEKWRLLAEAGLFGISVSNPYHGIGCDVMTVMYLLEALGYACEDAGLSFSAVSHMVSTAVPLEKFGTPEQKSKYLPLLVEGVRIGAHAISEPGSGSDAFSMRSKAVRCKEGYMLNGSKTFVTNGPVADLFIIYVLTDDEKGALGGISAFILEKEHPGLRIGRPIEKMGLDSSPFCEIFFDDCFLAPDQLLGREGNGFAIFNYVMKWEILCTFAVNIGEMRRQLEKCVDYARTRKQFGNFIGKYQAVSTKIADMRIALEASHLLLYQAGVVFQNGRNCGIELAVAKTFISEAFVKSSLDAIQIFGGYGYTKEFMIEKYLRDAVAGKIYSGSSEIQRNTITNLMGL